jgi:DNA-binding response OmpR family regulator
VRVLAGRIDAAIIDVGLSDRKGDALAAELRAMSAKLPIVMASGYLEQAFRVRFEGDRFVGFVGKPYDRKGLESALRALGIEAPAS